MNKEDEHNKFYMVELDDKLFKVDIRWGRFGTAGQQQSKTFPNLYQAQKFAINKASEKQRKGYIGTTKPRLERLNNIAKAIGTKNRILDIYWVKYESLVNYKSLQRASESELCDPSLSLGVMLTIDLAKPINNKSTHSFLVGYDTIYYIDTQSNFSVVDSYHPYYSIVEKVEEAVGAYMS